MRQRLELYFHFAEHGTTWRTEVLAGLTTFVTMAYIIFVNPAIKTAICREATGDRSWMAKVRPMWGHNYHFHVRIACPEGDASCVPQESVKAGDGCDASLAWWFKDEVLHPRLNPDAKPKPPISMAEMPEACRQVLVAQ